MAKQIMALHPMVELLESQRDFFAGVEDVEVVALTEGPAIIHNREDVALAGPDSIKKSKQAEKDGYKAICFTCHGDPNLYSIREAVRIPVIGTIEVAMHFCAMLAHRFSILVPDLPIKRWQEENAVKYGFESSVASIRVVPFKLPLEEVSKLSRQKPMPEEIISPTVDECIKAIREDGAGAITFGCGAFKRMADELGKRLKEEGFEIPVINPLPLAVDVARALIRQRLSHSLLSYPHSG